MSNKKIVIAGAGCALADYLYNRISFDSEAFSRYRSKSTGDGGLSPGKLVFTEELEMYAGKPYPEIASEITGDSVPNALNVGGPSIVPLIHAAQMLDKKDYEVKFYGVAGTDETADKIIEITSRTPLNIDNYIKSSKKATPFTDVFSDPDYDNGHGERTFVNNIGAAWDCTPEHLSDELFDSDIVCFGGTGLVPNLHDNLTSLLRKGKSRGCITVVNTVFDFRNQKKNPGKPWPLVDLYEDYSLIDLLMMDRDEALNISGTASLDEASRYFASTGASAVIITNGANDLIAWSHGGLFEKTGEMRMPVSNSVRHDLKTGVRPKGDTTGCGDNFAGGVITSIAWQMKEKETGHFNLTEALSWGIASGGFCCFTIGGTYLEKKEGEKKDQVRIIQEAYLKQTGY